MILCLERQNLEHKYFDKLINAGDFYHKMEVRRLKALKPYIKAKHHIQNQNLQKKASHERIYQ